MEFTVWSFLLVASASQSLFLLISFAIKKGGNRSARTLLSIMLVVCLAINVSNIWYAAFLYREIQGVAGFARGMLLLLGPLFYLYTLSISHANFRLRWSHLWHGTPYIMAIGSMFFLGGPPRNGSMEQLLDSFMEGQLPINVFSIVRFEFYILHILTYLFFARRAFLKLETSIDQDFTISLKTRKSWLQKITVFLFILVGMLIYFTWYMAETGFYTVRGNFTMTLVTSGLIYFIAFKAILASNEILPEFKIKKDHTPDREHRTQLLDQLHELLDQQKVFRNASLKLGDVAQSLGIGQHVLSAYLNRELGKSFFEWINDYRVNEFIRIAQTEDYKNYSISGMANEVGFKSKSSFYTAFKKSTGLTPSEYLKTNNRPK